jgi:hypothetical protein
MTDRQIRLVRAGIPAAAICAALLLGACSSNEGTKSQPSGTGTPAQNFTAHALNLVPSDFPSTWKTTNSTGGSNPVRSGVNTCVSRQHVSTPATVAVSKNFLDGTTGQEVGSQVQIFDRSGQATHGARIAGSSAVSSCLGPTVQTSLSKNLPAQETLTNVTASVLSSKDATPQDFGQQVVATISYTGKDGKPASEDVYVDVLGFAQGAALVEAEFENAGSAPPAALESSTMATLAKRAGAG